MYDPSRTADGPRTADPDRQLAVSIVPKEPPISSLPDFAASLLACGYRIESEIGRGGMATVYRALDLKHERTVAVKVMRPEVAAAMGRERFLREIRIAAQLDHPHVLALFDSGAAGEHLYYIMPYVDGESLRARLARQRSLPVDEALRVATAVAGALTYAHERGVVHRDIKPENILLSKERVLVADFGVAHIATVAAEGDTTALVTAQGIVLGTPRYMSPEQARGDAADGRADQYGLACVLYEMLAGQPPFIAPTYDAMLRMHATLEPRSVLELRPSVSTAVAQVIGRALAKAPADRYSSALQFAAALAMPSADVVAGPLLAGAGALDRALHHVPRPRTRFIGREREISDCAAAIAESRLLTLTGIGGCGKTRLAIELARRLRTEYSDGVWFVDLAPVTQGSSVVAATATALGLRETAGKEMLEMLREHVRGKRMLVLLDNCEHVLDAATELADALLAASEELHLLVTSREGLGVPGERLVALRSLAVPAAAADRDLRQVEASDAVRLFVDRAQAALHGFRLSSANAPVVAEICRRLDGIPLALELAAARVRMLSVEQIRDKLDQMFRLLTGGTRTAVARQQTLQATIQWSYDLLSQQEAALLRTVSVFAGGWTLSLATQLEGGADEFEMLDRLERLVDKSLVQVDDDRGSDARYRLLEAVRLYARERLAESGAAATLQRRHADVFAALAAAAYAERLHGEEMWTTALEVEHDNLRAALDTRRDADREQYLELAGDLAWFWQARSHLQEARAHLSAALVAVEAEPPRPAYARTLWGEASVLVWQGDTRQGLRSMHDALALWRRLGDRTEVALALEGIGWAQILAGNEESALETFEECLRSQPESSDQRRTNRARAGLTQALVALGRVDEARPLATEIVAVARETGDLRNEHFGWHFLADCALIEGRCEESLRHYGQSLALARTLGDRLEMSFEVQGVAMSLAGRGDRERGLRISEASAAEFDRLGTQIHIRFWDALVERYIGAARRELGEAAAARAAAEGRAMEFDDAIEAALAAARE